MIFPYTVKSSFFENWPQSLQSLSIQTSSIELSEPDIWTLGGFTPWFRNATGYFESNFFSKKLLVELEEVTKKVPLVAPRIGYCSWKSPQIPTLASYKSRGVLHVISSENERVARGIAAHISTNAPLFLHLREWRNIPPWSEFRLFIRNRKVIGVSQYHHRDAYPEIQANLEAIKASLIPFSHKLIDALHMDTVVADVFVEQQYDGRFKTTLIELNSFIQRTDPCLYSWNNGGDFDGGIRYRKTRHNPYRNTTIAGKSTEPLGVFREEHYRST